MRNTTLENIHVKQDNLIIDTLVGVSWTKKIVIDAGVKVQYLLICRDGQVDIDIISDGEGAQSDVFALFLTKNSERVASKFISTVAHGQAQTRLTLLSLVGDKGIVAVDGGVVIAPWAQQTEAHLDEKTLILSDDVSIRHVPQLDVRANDVVASHGASIDRMDPNKHFYLQSKGVHPEQADRLLLEAEINAIFDEVKWLDDDLRDELFAEILGYLLQD